MSVPTHREGCRTRLFQTQCPDCRDKVFFFSCTCNSKVFFDKLGNPWPRHDDRCIPYLVRVLRSETGLSDKAILERVVEFADSRGLRVPSDIYDRLTEGSYPPRHRLEVINIRPYESEAAVIVEGDIREMNLRINILRRFDLSDSPIGRGVLGELGIGEWAEVTIRQMHTETEHLAHEFSFLMSQNLLDELRWNQGKRLAVGIRYFRPVGRDAVWLFDDAD